MAENEQCLSEVTLPDGQTSFRCVSGRAHRENKHHAPHGDRVMTWKTALVTQDKWEAFLEWAARYGRRTS